MKQLNLHLWTYPQYDTLGASLSVIDEDCEHLWTIGGILSNNLGSLISEVAQVLKDSTSRELVDCVNQELDRTVDYTTYIRNPICTQHMMRIHECTYCRGSEMTTSET